MRLESIVIYIVLVITPAPSFARAAVSAESQGGFNSFAEKIEKQTGYVIAYSQSDIRLSTANFPDISGLTATEALRKVLPADQYTLTVTGKHIIIHRVDRQPPEEDVATLEPVRAPGLTAHKIPPRQSVFSGETRLIIIREREKPVDEDILSYIDEGQPETARVRSSGTRIIINSVTAIMPHAEEDRTTHVREIPFRYDLFESQAFGNAAQTKEKKKSRRRNRLSFSQGLLL